MARTKQVARKSTPSSVPVIPCVTHNQGNVTIVNNSSHFVSCTLKRNIATEAGEIFSKYAEYFSVRAGTTKIVCLQYVERQGGAPVTVVGWKVAFSNYGVLFGTSDAEQNASRQWELLVEANGTYHLVDDPQNPPLTEDQIGRLTNEQFEVVETTLLRVLQQAPPYVDLYENLCQQLPETIVQRRHPEILRRAFESSRRNRRYRLPCWPNRYMAVRPDLDTGFSQTDLDKHLRAGSGRACIDVYWRALDRQPGGNADNRTVCFTFDCAHRTVSTRTANNWDGTLERSEYQPKSLSSAIQSNVPGSFSEFLAALRTLGPGDSECTILDSTTEDCEEYDTTWSSHEIVVFLPRVWTPSTHHRYPPGFHSLARQFLLVNHRVAHLPTGVVHKILSFAAPLDCVPVARLHQRCVFGPQYRTYRVNEGEQPPPQIPPTVIQSSVLQAARDLIGMGNRVNTWAEAGDGAPPCRAKQDTPVDLARDRPPHGFYLCGFLHPLYFEFAPRNVVDDATKATSQDWVSDL